MLLKTHSRMTSFQGLVPKRTVLTEIGTSPNYCWQQTRHQDLCSSGRSLHSVQQVKTDFSLRNSSLMNAITYGFITKKTKLMIKTDSNEHMWGTLCFQHLCGQKYAWNVAAQFWKSLIIPANIPNSLPYTIGVLWSVCKKFSNIIKVGSFKS